MGSATQTPIFILMILTILASSNAQNDGARVGNSGFGFILLPPEQTYTSKHGTTVKPTPSSTGRNGTTPEAEQTTEPYSIFTFWDTTFEQEMITPMPTTSASTSDVKATTGKRTELPLRTKKEPLKVPAFTSSSPSTKPKPTSATTEIFVMKNTGMKFIRVSPQGTTAATPRSRTVHDKTNALPRTALPETTELDYTATKGGDESFVPFVPVVTLGAGLSKDHESLVLAWKTIFPYYHYLMSPRKFWAKYWYWIPILLILLVVFFFIPGFCCQLHWKSLEKRWRNLRLFRNSVKRERDIEKGASGKAPDPKGNEAPDSGRASSAVLSTSSGAVSEPCYDHVAPEPDETSKRQSQHSQAESGIHLQKDDEILPRVQPKSNEVPTCHMLLDTVQAIHLSQCSSNIDPSLQFPEPASSNVDLADEIPLHRASALSQSDNGLDIGNETIIKSNPVNDGNRRTERQATGLPPLRPPKPNHLIPKAVGPDIAPERRPKRSKKRPRSGSPKKERRGRKLKPRNNESNKAIKQPSNSRKKGIREMPDKRSEAKRKQDLRNKKKIQSSTQSLMKAAQSLEDLLDAITKLTREYPIPEVPRDVNSEVTTKKPRKRTRSLSKRSREERKSKRRNRSLDLSRHIRDETEKVVSKTKKHRTQNWTKEQKRIEIARDKKKRRQDDKRKKQEPVKKVEKERKEKHKGEKEEKEITDNITGKVPTLVKQDLTPEDRTKQERRRMRLERDLKKLQKFHNSKVGKEGESEEMSEVTEAKPKKE